MLKLPPPIWAFAYILIAAGMSYLAGWSRVPGLPLVWLAVVLIMFGITLAAAAVVLFRREGTEINPTSMANRKLVTSGPFRLTRIRCIWLWLSLRRASHFGSALGPCSSLQ